MEYLSKSFIRQYREEFNEIVEDLKNELGNEWSFHHYLVGSARRNLVLDSNEGFDLDYHFRMNNWPDGLTDKEVKYRMMDALDNVTPDNLSYCEDSTHVITTKNVEGSSKIYSYDIALIYEGINTQILKNEKQNDGDGPYHYVDVPDSGDFHEKYKMITGAEMWNDLRDIYKDKKIEQHAIQKDFRPLSFSLLISTIHEVLQMHNLI